MAILGFFNVTLSVQSVLEVGNFFVEKIGLKVEFKLGVYPVSARVWMGNNYLYLFETTAPKPISGRSIIASQNFPGFDHISIKCDDIDLEFESMRENGVEFDGVPYTYPHWGVRMVAFKDPEENWYYLFQRLMS